jgi:flagellar hook-length control protein FliK
MGLPTSVSFRASPIDPTSLIPAAPRQSDASDDQDRFERHLDDTRSREDHKVDRRDDRRERDRTENTRNAKKSDSDTTTKKDTDETSDETPTPAVAVVQAPITPTTDVKAPKVDAVAKTGDAEAATPAPDAGDLLKADKVGDAKPGMAENATPVATPKIAEAAASKTDEKNPKDADKVAAADALVAAPVAAHAASHKADVPAPKADLKSDVTAPTGPVAASQAPLVAAAANANTDADTQQTSADATDPDSGLAIKSKEGLGHEAAASMADKSDTKTTAAQQTASNAQTPAAQASAAAPTNFAKMLATAAGGEVTSVSATGGGSDAGGAARLSDLQNVGNSTQNQNANTATVRIGTLPGQTTPTQVPAMAIALQVARNLQKGVNRFDIRLDPAEMGRIDVRMEVKKDGNVAAHLTVDRPETLDLLKRDSGALQQALNDAGLQANADSLNFSLRDQSGGNTPNFGSSAPGTSSIGQTAATEETVVSPTYNINLSATGGVDIRV